MNGGAFRAQVKVLQARLREARASIESMQVGGAGMDHLKHVLKMYIEMDESKNDAPFQATISASLSHLCYGSLSHSLRVASYGCWHVAQDSYYDLQVLMTVLGYSAQERKRMQQARRYS